MNRLDPGRCNAPATRPGGATCHTPKPRTSRREVAAFCSALLLTPAAFAAAPADPADPPSAVDASQATSVPTAGTTAELDEIDPDRLGPSFTIFYENDGSFLRPGANSDRHYTSGQGFSVAWHQDAADDWADALDLDHDGTALGFSVVQQMFTPRNIRLADPPPDDRPFAGYLYLGGYAQRQYGNQFDHLELDLGVVGPSSGAEFNQEWVHDLIKEPDPDWSSQLGDEFTYNLSYRHKWRMDLTPRTGAYGTLEPADEWGLQLLPEVGFDVGNVYRRAHAGAALRLGFNLPDDFGPGRLIEPGSATGQPIRGLSTYAYVKAVGRYVEWNTFLDGSNSRNPSRSVSKQPFLGEFTAGFAVDWQYNNWVCNISYGQTHRTREFDTQSTNDGFGHLAVRLQYQF